MDMLKILEGYWRYRELGDGRFLAVERMLWGKARLHLISNVAGPDKNW